jgi:hypothetical protein
MSSMRHAQSLHNCSLKARGTTMNALRIGGLLSVLSGLLACSHAPAAPVGAGDDPEPLVEADAVGEVSQALDTQGFLEARGYYMSTDTVAGDCITAADGSDVIPVQAPNTGGQEVIFSLALIESSSDVQKRLSLSASASAKFLVAGGDAKFKFAEETRTTDTTATLLASIVVRNTSYTVPPGIKLRDDAAALLRGVAGKPASLGQLARFRMRCGDGFLHSYTTGGEFHAMIQVQTSSAEEKRAVSASLAGNYLTFSGSAAFETALQKIVSNSSTLVRTYQIGGEGPTTSACADVSCVTSRLDAFTSAVSSKPVVYASTVKPYSLLALPNDATTPTDIAVTLDQMETINVNRNAARDLLSRLVDVQTNPENYVVTPSALEAVSAAVSTLNGNMNKLNGALKTCGRTPSACALPSLSAVSATMPSPKPLPSKVILRSFARPSRMTLDGGKLSGCSGTFVQARDVDDRADAEQGVFNLVAGRSGAPGSLSFQSLLQPTANLVANIPSPCSSRIRLAVPTTRNAKENATFYRVRGLNGKPNTWSFRLFATPDAEGVGGADRNRDPNVYLSLSKSTNANLAIYPLPEVGTAADEVAIFKDKASWYLDEQ